MGRIIGILALILLGAGLVVGLMSIFTVHQTQTAIVLRFGEPQRVIQDPGLNVKAPFLDTVVFFDKRILDLDIRPDEVLASDQKRLVVDAFCRFRIKDPLQFYKTLNNELRARQRLDTIVNARLRSSLAAERFATLLSGERATIMERITQAMNQDTLERFGVEIVDVRLKRVDLPEANSEAAFRRMRSAREREAQEIRARGNEAAKAIMSTADKERIVILAEARKQSEIIRGEGDAQRNRIFAEAFGQDADFFAFYRAMKAYEKALSSSDTSMVLSPDSEFFRYFGRLQGRASR